MNRGEVTEFGHVYRVTRFSLLVYVLIEPKDPPPNPLPCSGGGTRFFILLLRRAWNSEAQLEN
jgi:hypothetical protein